MNLRSLSGFLFLVCALAVQAGAGVLHGPVINPANGRAYYLLEADTWQGSVGQAYALGGHLVVINDQAENDWVQATFGRFGGVARNLWLGLSDAAKEATFEWVNRDPVSFSRWKAGEPDNAQEAKHYAFLVAPAETGAGGEWAISVNAGDGGVVPFHGVVEADHLEHDSAAEWITDFRLPRLWRSGWRAGASGEFKSFTVPDQTGYGLRVFSDGSRATPNARSNYNTIPAGTPVLQPYELVLEPGASGEYAECIWTAPMSGTFVVEAAFQDIDPAGDGQDVHVLVDGAEVFSAMINAADGSSRATYTSPVPIRLMQGTTVIIRVGAGGVGHDAQGDSTRVDAVLRYPGTTVAYYSSGTSPEVDGVRIDNAGNAVVSFLTSDNQRGELTYDADGNLLSRGAGREPLRDSEGNYARLGNGKVSKCRGTDGGLLWEQPFAGQTLGGIQFDSGGNLVAAGSVADPQGGTDFYVVKYAALDGAVLWEKRIDGTGTEASAPRSQRDSVGQLAIDPEGDVLITGRYEPVGPYAPSPDGMTYSYCIEKRAGQNGSLLWRSNFARLFKGRIADLKTDSKGDVVAFGVYEYNWMSVWKFSGSTGHGIWGRSSENPFGREPFYHWSSIGRGRCSFDMDDNVVITADLNGVSTGADFDLYAAKYEAKKGTRFWERRWRSLGDDSLGGAAVDAEGNITVAGSISGSTRMIRYEAPVIDDQYADMVGHTDAVLHGLVRIVDPAAKVYFEYGTDASYGIRTPEMPLPQDGLVSAAINGLSAPNIYHFRLVEQTPQGLVFGEDQVFDMAKAPNLAPVAQSDSYEDPVPAGSSELVIDVLGNDSDPDGDQLQIKSVSQGLSQGLYGTVSTDGAKVIYRPAAGFSADRFSYTIVDAYGSTASGSVEVRRFGEKAPVATDDSAQVRSGVFAEINVLANDSDPEGKPLSILTYTQGAHGAVSSGSVGRLFYKSTAGYVGEDQFTYTIRDGVLTAQATVRITVEGLLAVDDVVQVVSEAIDIDVLANDIDPDGKALDVVDWTQPANGRAFGTATNRMHYVPNAGFVGEDQFTYTVSNHDSSAQGTVRVTVVANMPPVAVDDVGSTSSGPVELNVLANDSDPEGKPLTITSFTQPANGAVDTTAGGKLRYSPFPGFSGEDQFTYTIYDGVNSAQATVRVTVSDWLVAGTILASSGAEVPGVGESEGVPAGAKFRSFGLPSINDREEVAFTATYGAGEEGGNAVFAGLPLQLIARKGAPAPDRNGQPLTNGEVFRSFRDPLLNPRGDVAFLARISRTTQQRTFSGLWLKPAAGNLRMVLREGEVAAGVNGARWSAFVSVGLTDSGAIPFVATLQMGRGGVTQASALGLWIWTDAGTRLLLRQGDRVSVKGRSRQVKSFAALAPAKDSPGQGRLGVGEEVLVRVSWNDGTQSLLKVSPGAAPEVIASTGDVLTGREAKFSSFGIPSPDRQGGFVVRATLQQGVGGVKASSDTGVFKYTPGSGWSIVVREGEPRPDDPLKEYGYRMIPFYAITEAVSNAEGRVALLAAGGKRWSYDLWWTASAGLTLAHTWWGKASWTGPIVSFAYPDGENASLVYLVDAPLIDSSGDRKKGQREIGLWALDQDGLSRLLCKSGQTLSIDGVTRTIRDLDILELVPGSPSQPRSYNSKGKVVCRLIFTDGSQAVLKGSTR